MIAALLDIIGSIFAAIAGSKAVDMYEDDQKKLNDTKE